MCASLSLCLSLLPQLLQTNWLQVLQNQQKQQQQQQQQKNSLCISKTSNNKPKT